MFIQHNDSVSPLVASFNNHSDDFELLIQKKSINKIQGKIRFQYLQQKFEAAIVITTTSIQIQSQYPFTGIQASSSNVENPVLSENVYIVNGSLTKQGHLNISWLILDTIHLYNLLRLKPGSILELYREAFSFAKEQDPQLVFGQIELENPIAKSTAKLLGQKMKRKHKYQYGNNLDLLVSIQQILGTYPQQFLAPKTIVGNLVPVLS
jgi:hypothetical protein